MDPIPDKREQSKKQGRGKSALSFFLQILSQRERRLIVRLIQSDAVYLRSGA